MKKRLMAVLLSMVMLLGLFPATALAATRNEDGSSTLSVARYTKKESFPESGEATGLLVVDNCAMDSGSSKQDLSVTAVPDGDTVTVSGATAWTVIPGENAGQVALKIGSKYLAATIQSDCSKVFVLVDEEMHWTLDKGKLSYSVDNENTLYIYLSKELIPASIDILDWSKTTFKLTDTGRFASEFAFYEKVAGSEASVTVKDNTVDYTGNVVLPQITFDGNVFNLEGNWIENASSIWDLLTRPTSQYIVMYRPVAYSGLEAIIEALGGNIDALKKWNPKMTATEANGFPVNADTYQVEVGLFAVKDLIPDLDKMIENLSKIGNLFNPETWKEWSTIQSLLTMVEKTPVDSVKATVKINKAALPTPVITGVSTDTTSATIKLKANYSNLQYQLTHKVEDGTDEVGAWTPVEVQESGYLSKTYSFKLDGLTHGETYSIQLKSTVAEGDTNHKNSEVCAPQEFTLTDVYTVNFYASFEDIAGGEAVYTFEVVQGGKLNSLPEAPEAPEDQEGKVFDNWYYTADTEKTLTKNTTINSDINAYAKWLDTVTYTKVPGFVGNGNYLIVSGDYAMTTSAFDFADALALYGRDVSGKMNADRSTITFTAGEDAGVVWNVVVDGGKATLQFPAPDSKYLTAGQFALTRYLQKTDTSASAWALNENSKLVYGNVGGLKKIIGNSFRADSVLESSSPITLYWNGKAVPEYTVPTGLTATCGNTLNDVTLPDGWAWEDATTPVGAVGSNSFKATFTPEDPETYMTMTGIYVTVTVSHDAELTGGQAATCTEAGYEDAWYCEGCATYFSDEICENEITDYETWKTGDGKIDALGHDWNYSASGAELTADCGRDDCDATETLTLVAPAKTVYGDGNSAAATFGTPAPTSFADSALPTINYAKKTGENTYGDATTTAPTGAGAYKASITVGTATASVEYSIGKATPAITTNPTASAITKGQKLSNSNLTNGEASVAGNFAWTNPDTEPNASGSYSVTFTPADADNYNSVTFDVDLTVNNPAPPAPSHSSSAPTTYTITCNDGVKADRNTASKNTTVTLTVADGYSTPIVKDKDGKVIEVTKKDNGTYTFKMPASAVTITASGHSVCLRDEDCPINAYADTKNDFWWHDGIHYCLENGLMVGFPDGTFQPNGSTTRAQIVTILWRLAGGPVVNYAMSFTDVPDGYWFTEAVRWAQSVGVVEGYDETTFGPNDPITREQMATIFYNYVSKVAGKGFKGNWMFLLPFEDRGDIAERAYEPVCWCNMNSIITGREGNLFAPKSLATRAEVATMIQRFCENLLG